jgi:hypothetical protein
MVDEFGMSETTVEVAEDEDRYHDRDGLEAELQGIARAKAPEPTSLSGASGRTPPQELTR